MIEFVSSGISDTLKFSKMLTKHLKRGDVVLLEGDLGAGKTTFVKCFVKSLGGDDSSVTSPTFTIVNEYLVNDLKIYHLDLYRLKTPDELYNIGIEDYLYGDGICFIEWPERAMEIFDNYKKIEIKKLGETKRGFVFNEE